MNKKLRLDMEDSDINCCNCDFKPTEKTSVLKSLKTIGEYDYQKGEYIKDSHPVENAWEVIVSGNSEFIDEQKEHITIYSSGLFFFCPECEANLEQIKR